MENTDNQLLAALLLFGGYICPEALAGAVVGALFFSMLPSQFTKMQLAVYVFISVVIGYSTGLAFPAEWRMLTGFLGAALGVVFLMAIVKALQYDKWEEVVAKFLEIYKTIRGSK